MNGLYIRKERWRLGGGGQRWGMGMEIDFPWGGRGTMQCADDAFLSCTLEIYMVLQINVTSINSKKETNKHFFPNIRNPSLPY